MSVGVFVSGQPYAAVPFWLLDSGASHRALKLWCILYRLAFEEGARHADLTYAQLASMVDESPSSIRRAIKDLEVAGALVVHPVFEAGFQVANRYELLFVQGCSPVVGGVTSEHPGVSPVNTLPILKELKNTESVSNDFDTLWKTYPRRIGKKAVYAKYAATLNRCSDATPAILLSAVQAYAKETVDTEQRFIKRGETFFGPNEHWRDYVKNPVAAPTGDVLVVSQLWDAYYTDPNHLVPLPSPLDPHIAPDGRPYTSKAVGPYLKRIWLDA